MKYLFSLLAIILLSPVASALEFSSEPLPYTDGPFTQATEAGIRVLTDMNAVSGNPDGSFAANRTLNRAEFVKIVVLSMQSINQDTLSASSCFPDVNTEDWFSMYVCFAKENNVLAGYPDGTFKPGNPVNYAEALKILGELYEVEFTTTQSTAWYQGYADAAIALGVALPSPPAYNASLTRGQMARLTAAYVANAQGALTEYRLAEQGTTQGSVSSMQSSESSSSESSAGEQNSSETESSSTSSSPEVKNEFGLQSRLLLPGTTTAPIIGGIFTSESQADLRIVLVRFDREVRSFKHLEARLADGTVLGQMKLDAGDSDDETWRGEFTDALQLQAGEPVIIYVHAEMNTTDSIYQSSELIVPRTMRIIAQDTITNASLELLGGQPPFPNHIAALSTVDAITSSDVLTANLAAGTKRELATFSLNNANNSTLLQAKEIVFTLEKTNDVTLSAVEISKAGLEGLTNSCSVQTGTIRCTIIDQRLQNIVSDDVYIVTGTVVKTGNATGTVQLSINDPGSTASIGSLRLFDGATNFTWLNNDTPMFTGTLWSVE